MKPKRVLLWGQVEDPLMVLVSTFISKSVGSSVSHDTCYHKVGTCIQMTVERNIKMMSCSYKYEIHQFGLDCGILKYNISMTRASPECVTAYIYKVI